MRLIGGPGKDHPARRRRQGWALSTDDRAGRGPGSPEMGAALIKCTAEMLQRYVESLRAWNHPGREDESSSAWAGLV